MMLLMILALWLGLVQEAKAQTINIVPRKLVTIAPPNTPTPIPTKIIIQLPSNIIRRLPTVAGESPTVKPTVTTEPVISPTVVLSLSPTVAEEAISPSPTPTETEKVLTPTPMSQPKATDQSLVVIFLSAVIGLLVIIILAQAWPRDKEDKE
jgi:hypothetical protein